MLGTYDQIAEALDQLERCGALRVRTTEACGVPVSGRSLALDDGAAQ